MLKRTTVFERAVA
jgi:uncharacterized protein (DUF3084 family)